VLSSNKQIRQCKEQLLESNMIIRQQHNELDTLQQQWKESEEEGEKNTEKLNEELHQTKITNQKLVKKLNDAENEMNTLRSRFTSLQQSSLKVHEFEGEVIQLRHSLGEQQRLRGELERTMESMKREAEKHKMEKTDLRQRLEQSSRQLSEMQERSEEWRGNREQLQAKVIKLQNLIDEKEKAFKELKDNLMELEDTNKCRQSDNESSINELQRELNKRSEQVMDLDCALRKHQGETAAKILQMERTLAQRQADLKMRTQEVEDLTKKYHQAQKVGQELQQLLDKTKSPDMVMEIIVVVSLLLLEC
jgi:chromosome segregation ATPase